MTEKKEITDRDVATELAWKFFYYVEGGPEYYRTPSRVVDKVEFIPNFTGSADVALLWVVPKLVELHADKRFPHRRIAKIIEGALDDDRSIALALCKDLMEWKEKP